MTETLIERMNTPTAAYAAVSYRLDKRMLWSLLGQLEERLNGRADARRVDQKDDRHVTAAIEIALDHILAARGDVMRVESRQAKSLHDGLVQVSSDFDQSPLYLAGRLGSLAELLGIAAERCAPAQFEAKLRDRKFEKLIQALHRTGSLTNTELAAAMGESEESACRKLRELKEIGAVVFDKRGRQVFNSLAPAARAVLSLAPPELAHDSTRSFQLSTIRPIKRQARAPVRQLPRLEAVA